MAHHRRSLSSKFFPFPPSMSSRSLLLATIPSIDPPHFLAPIIATAATTTTNRLTIALFSRHFNSPCLSTTAVPPGISHTEYWDDVQRLLTYVYVQATRVAQELDKILMDIDVLLLGIDMDVPEDLGKGYDVVIRVSGDSIPIPLPSSINSIRQCYLPGDRDSDSPPSPRLRRPSLTPKTSPNILSNPLPSEDQSSSTSISDSAARSSFYPVVALGGTFDHLHAGHKILLSMGAWITSEKLIVGMTDDVMLQKKANKEVLESLEIRMHRVREFLTLFKPSITYDIVPINDVYGPTGWDPNVQALVVSKESLSGADAIAKHRAAKNLPALDTYIIDVISSSETLDHDDVEMLKHTKMSSTFIRQWIIDKQKADAAEAAKAAKGDQSH